tara:strand:- start:550 stop:810 length:261 start_codon:yes stop_codon:yes gene_type:complete
LNQKKVRELKKRIKPMQVEWMQSLLPPEEAKKVSIETINSLLPDEKYMEGIKGITLLHMSDKWLLKKLKKHPDIKTYKQLQEKLNV